MPCSIRKEGMRTDCLYQILTDGRLSAPRYEIVWKLAERRPSKQLHFEPASSAEANAGRRAFSVEEFSVTVPPMPTMKTASLAFKLIHSLAYESQISLYYCFRGTPPTGAILDVAQINIASCGHHEPGNRLELLVRKPTGLTRIDTAF